MKVRFAQAVVMPSSGRSSRKALSAAASAGLAGSPITFHSGESCFIAPRSRYRGDAIQAQLATTTASPGRPYRRDQQNRGKQNNKKGPKHEREYVRSPL